MLRIVNNYKSMTRDLNLLKKIQEYQIKQACLLRNKLPEKEYKKIILIKILQ